MNITQILQIADWSIINTGNSFIESTIPGQIKFAYLGETIVHFNKDTDEVVAIVILPLRSSKVDDQIIIYAIDTVVDIVMSTYNELGINSNNHKELRRVTDYIIIEKLNKLYNREPDSMLEIENMNGMTLAVIDDLADKAGLTRNGYMIKIICEQISAINPELSA